MKVFWIYLRKTWEWVKITTTTVKRRGQKVQPGKTISKIPMSTPKGKIETSNKSKKQASQNPLSDISNEAPGPSNDSHYDDNENEDNDWYCGTCSGMWKMEGNDVWIQCNDSDTPFHLQCCGMEYNQEDYYESDIENISFTWWRVFIIH